jgi:tetratricopeptide (TPR) repeat protein
MSERHPDLAALSGLLSGEVGGEEARALERHMLACSRCEERFLDLLPRNGVGEPAPLRLWISRSGAEAGRRWRELARERREAAGLFERLERLAPELRAEAARSLPAFATWGLFERLAAASHGTLHEDPLRAEGLARLAVSVAEALDADRYGPPAVEAARTQAQIHLANALRVRSDFQASEQAFRRAEEHRLRSWLDPLDEALLLELKAPLRRAQRRFDESLELIDGAIAIYREVNEPRLQGRALTIKGLTLQYRGDLARAAACFRDSLLLLDADESPRLVLAAQANLLGCLVDEGRAAEAEAQLPRALALADRFGKRTDRQRLRWIAARAAASRGRRSEAEPALFEIREAFVAQGLAYDAALATLDLAAIRAGDGRAEEVEELITEILPVFQALEVHREALAALLVLRQAAEREQLTLGLVEEVASFLRQAQGDPGLRFRAPERGAPPGQAREVGNDLASRNRRV